MNTIKFEMINGQLYWMVEPELKDDELCDNCFHEMTGIPEGGGK